MINFPLGNFNKSYIEDKLFSKYNRLTVFLDYFDNEQANNCLQEAFDQHFPVYQCFLIVRNEIMTKEIEDLQILYPFIKIYHRPNADFLNTILELSKILDSQFVAVFNFIRFENKWKLAESVNKILNLEDWKFKLSSDPAISFVALRLVLEKLTVKQISEECLNEL